MSAESSNPREGDYFAIEESGPRTSFFHVIKVLNVDREGVYIRQYANQFDTIPGEMVIKDLEVAFGHLPLSRTAFARLIPTLVSRGSVSEEELDGYRYWMEEGGGYFA